MKNSNSQQIAPRSLFENLLYMGIATFFLWPFIQLWSIKAIPLFESDVHLRASIALENVLETALTKPFRKMKEKEPFKPIPGEEEIGLVGRTEIGPHPELENMTLVRSQVKWGSFPFQKSMSLEVLQTRTKP